MSETTPKLKCKVCGRPSNALKYGRCYGTPASCFEKWPDKDNPEPCAKKVRFKASQLKKNGRRGSFIVKCADGKFYTPKKTANVPQVEAFVFTWFNPAHSIARMNNGEVLELKVFGAVEK